MLSCKHVIIPPRPSLRPYMRERAGRGLAAEERPMSYDRKAIGTLEGLPPSGDPRQVYAAGETPPELAAMLMDAIDRYGAEYEQGCERRRKTVRRVFRSNALAGIRANLACQKIFDAYVIGSIELAEMMPLIRLALGCDPKLSGKAIEPDFLDLLLSDIRTN